MKFGLLVDTKLRGNKQYEYFKTPFGASFSKHENFLLEIFSVRRRHSSRGLAKLAPQLVLLKLEERCESVGRN